MRSIQLWKKFSTSSKLGYVNNFNLEGKISDVARDVQRIIDAQATTGLILNKRNCKIVANDLDLVDKYQFFRHFKMADNEDLTYLGGPVLQGRATDKVLQEKIADLERVIKRLALLQAHDTLCLLKNSISMPKLLQARDVLCLLKNSISMPKLLQAQDALCLLKNSISMPMLLQARDVLCLLKNSIAMPKLLQARGVVSSKEFHSNAQATTGSWCILSAKEFLSNAQATTGSWCVVSPKECHALCMLKNSIAMPKLLYLLRTSPYRASGVIQQDTETWAVTGPQCGTWWQTMESSHLTDLHRRSWREERVHAGTFSLSAAATLEHQNAILAWSVQIIEDYTNTEPKSIWMAKANTIIPTEASKQIPKASDTPITAAIFQRLMDDDSNTPRDMARLRVVAAPHWVISSMRHLLQQWVWDCQMNRSA